MTNQNRAAQAASTLVNASGGHAMSRPARISILGALLVFVPSSALAHGQQVVFVPIGQLAALAPVAFVAWRFTSGFFPRLVIIACALIVPFYYFGFVQIRYIPDWLVEDEISSFLSGFVSSVFVAFVVALPCSIFWPPGARKRQLAE